MASNKTPNLNLPQYSGTDLFNLEEVNESYKKIDNSYKEINDNYNKAIQEGSTGNLEVIDARGGHTKLKERLDSIDSSLETNKKHTEGYVNIKEFGAIGDGTTDDTEAIKKCINFALNNSLKKILFPKVESGYIVTDTISITGDIDVVMESPLIYDNAENKPCLVIGSQNSYYRANELKLQAIKKTQSTWSDYHEGENINIISVGILIYNLAQCIDCNIVKIQGFTVGLEVMASEGLGNYHNTYNVGELRNNKVALEISNTKGGWANSNIFNGACMTVSSNVNLSEDRYYLKITRRSGSYWSNSNLFSNFRFEGGKPTSPAKCIPISFGGSSQNRVNDCRIENASNDLAVDFGTSRDNIVSSIMTINNSTTILGNTDIYRNKFISDTANEYNYYYTIYSSPNFKNDLIINRGFNNKGWYKGVLFNGYDKNTHANYYIHETRIPTYNENEQVMVFSAYDKPTVFINSEKCKQFMIEGDFGLAKRYLMLFDKHGNNISSPNKVIDSCMTYYLFNGYLVANKDASGRVFMLSFDDDVASFGLSFLKVNHFVVKSLNASAYITKNAEHLNSIPSKNGRIMRMEINDDDITNINTSYTILGKTNER